MATANLKRSRTTVRTHEGAPAKRIGNEAQLRRSVMSCLLGEDEFYEDGQQIADRIAEGVRGVSQATAMAIAIEARHVMHLRHAPLWIVREMARRGGAEVGDALQSVILRADELTEFLALYWSAGKEPLSAQVKRGLALAFQKFNEYQLAKYDRDGKEIRLRDVLFLSHAKPKDEAQAALWKRLIAGTMATPDTWEVELSAKGNTKESWERLLTERKVGNLGLLRNLRNMEQAGVNRLLIREAILRDQFKHVLPFRFIASARYAPEYEPDLEQAMFRKAAEMPRLPGRTVILIDHSRSMEAPVSAKSEMTRFDAAAALAMIARELSDDVAVYTFSDSCIRVPSRRGFALRDAIFAYVNPVGTMLGRAVKQIHAEQGSYDRLIVITDEQSADTPPAPIGKGYVINVASARNGIGYGAWSHIDGWSEGVLRYIQAVEHNG